MINLEIPSTEKVQTKNTDVHKGQKFRLLGLTYSKKKKKNTHQYIHKLYEYNIFKTGHIHAWKQCHRRSLESAHFYTVQFSGVQRAFPRPVVTHSPRHDPWLSEAPQVDEWPPGGDKKMFWAQQVLEAGEKDVYHPQYKNWIKHSQRKRSPTNAAGGDSNMISSLKYK